MNDKLNSHEQTTLLTFPARFSIRVMGKNTPTFQLVVLEIVNVHIPEADRIDISTRVSKNSAYLSITITAIFHDKPSIDAVYLALSAEPLVIMTL